MYQSCVCVVFSLSVNSYDNGKKKIFFPHPPLLLLLLLNLWGWSIGNSFFFKTHFSNRSKIDRSIDRIPKQIFFSDGISFDGFIITNDKRQTNKRRRRRWYREKNFFLLNVFAHVLESELIFITLNLFSSPSLLLGRDRWLLAHLFKFKQS